MFFLSISLTACRLWGRWNLHSMSCSVTQSCTSGHHDLGNVTRDYWLFNKVIRTWYFFNPLMVASWFAWWRGKFWLGQTLHKNQGIFITLSWRKGDNTINLPIPHQFRTPVDGPRLLWQLSWVLFRTQRTCYYWINQVTVFQRKLASLAMCHPTWAPLWRLFLCTESAVSIVGSGARTHTQAGAASWLPGAVSTLEARIWKTVRTASGSCRWTQMCFYISSSHKDLLRIIYPSACHCPSHRVNF